MNPDNKWPSSHIGTTQASRNSARLMPGYVPIDERTMGDLLALAVDYGKLLHFYDDRNRIRGDWSAFWLKDLSIFLAYLGQTEHKHFEERYRQAVDDFHAGYNARTKAQALVALIAIIFDLQATIQQWYAQTTAINATRSTEVQGIELDLYQLIKYNLRDKLLELHSYQFALLLANIINAQQVIHPDDLPKIWGDLEAVEPAELEGTEAIDLLQRLLKKIELIFNAFYKAVLHIKQRVPTYLRASLHNDDRHPPHTGLYLSFLKLFEIQQRAMNGLTSRHMAFYFSRMLGAQPLPSTPDRAHLYFELSDGVKRHRLPAGTALSAGKNANNDDIIYVLDSDVTLTRARISSLKTLFVSKNLSLGGSDYRLSANVYAAPIANSRDGFGAPFEGDEAPVWPTFGEDQFEVLEGQRTMQPVPIGMAITSPLFFLEEGQRDVTVHFTFEEASMQTYRKLLSNMAYRQQLANTPTSEQDIFNKLFEDAFLLQITTAQGWHTLDAYEVFLPNGSESNDFALSFLLDNLAPAWTAYDEATHQGQFRTLWPMLKVCLKPGKPTLSFLSSLQLAHIRLHVKVSDLKNFHLFNDLGRLDASKSFLPFGSTPSQGDSLLIGKAELFRKSLTRLDLTIHWQNLPSLYRGFTEYYKNYNLPIQNDTFKAHLTALSNSDFHPNPEATPIAFSLFETQPSKDPKAHRLASVLKLTDVPLSALNIQPDYYLSNTEEYDQNMRSGFLRLTLAEPDFGFGFDIYPKVFTRIVSENAANQGKSLFSGGKEKPPKDIPNQPFAPLMRQISIDYEAESSISYSATASRATRKRTPEEVYHLHPFGRVQTFAKGIALDAAFIPSFEADGYLYIGLEQLTPPEPLSLYFELVENNINLSEQAYRPVSIQWSFLAKNEWIDFTAQQLIADSTQSFTQSGVVTLDIPANITHTNTLMPAGIYWLRIAVSGDVHILSKALNIYTQGAVATWQSDDADEAHLQTPLSPYTLNSLLHTDNAVNAVFQPYPSFGGRMRESQQQFYTRVSDRLHHKQRGITSTDIESIVLQQFGSLRQACCFTASTHPDLVKPGTLKLVVVPAKAHQLHYTQPVVNFKQLQEIQQFLARIMPPAAQLEVINPVYEYVKVSCQLAFKGDTDEGLLLQRLNEAIRHYICPWIDDADAPVNLGQSLNKDDILSFMEQLPYVKFVTSLSLIRVYQKRQQYQQDYDIEDTAAPRTEKISISTNQPWSVLIPVTQHSITVVDSNAYQPPRAAGLNTMSIGVDYVIKPPDDATEDQLPPTIQDSPVPTQRYVLHLSFDGIPPSQPSPDDKS